MTSRKRGRKDSAEDDASAAKRARVESWPRSVLVGKGVVEVDQMREALFAPDAPIAALQTQLQEDGYLLLRGFLDREAVLEARRYILEQLSITAGVDLLSCDGAYPADIKEESVGLLSRLDIHGAPCVRSVLESPRLFDLFESLLGCPPGDGEADGVVTFGYKWLRSVCRGRYTGVHVDRVYLGRGTQRVHTAWIPFGDITPEMGTLAVCPGSHTDPAFRELQETYGQSFDRQHDTISGWVTEDPNELTTKYGGRQWVTTDFRAGDICVINLGIIHGSSTNMHDRLRISADTRWQPASEPLDERIKGVVRRTD